MTSRSTNLRTVSMISDRTVSSTARGAVTRVPPQVARRSDVDTAGREGFLTAITIHFAVVDAESQFREECFPMATGPMHRGLESAAALLPRHAGSAGGGRHAGHSATSTGPATRLRSTSPTRASEPGDRVAVMTSNRPEFVVAVHAVSKLGAAAGPAQLRPGRPSRSARRSDSPFLGTAWRTGRRRPPGRATGRGPRARSRRHHGSRSRWTARSHRPPPAAVVREADDAVLVFSSGTTDRPKAVRHTHRSICLGTAHWVAALGLGPRTGSRWRRRRRTSWGC